MRQDIIDLYDEFTHRGLDRRLFMERLATLAGGTAAAASALAVLRADPAKAAIVAPDDARLSARMVTIEVGPQQIQTYRARLADANQPKPVIIVIHENRGLNAHIEDVTRRMALEGFLAVAPDMLSSQGGTPSDEDKAREMIGQLDQGQVMSELAGVIAALKSDPDGNGKVGIMGFCWGGGIVGQAAVRIPDVDAAVVYYGRVPPLERVPNVQTPLLLHYAAQDANVNAGVPGFEEALKAAGKDYTLHMYEGAQHAFNNDTSAARYNQQAAELAWARTVEFLRQNLATSA